MRRHQKLFMQGIFPLLFLFPTVAAGQSSTCNPLPRELLNAPRREFTGPYVNKAYDYSVVIPDHLVGYDDANPFYQRGFAVLLRQSPASFISLSGGVNSLEHKEAMDAVLGRLEFLRRKGKEIDSVTITRSLLGALAAATMVARYTCADSGERYVQSTTIALSPNRGMLYEVTLYAAADGYDGDRLTLDQILKTWKYIGGERAAPAHAE